MYMYIVGSLGSMKASGPLALERLKRMLFILRGGIPKVHGEFLINFDPEILSLWVRG